MYGTDIGEVMGINVQFPNGVIDLSSPFESFASLVANLEATLSGASLAKRAMSVSDAVSKLAELHSEGILTTEEFERAKSGFVGSPVEVAESSASLLRQLYALHQTGILTESEFNMKKWDILGRAT